MRTQRHRKAKRRHRRGYTLLVVLVAIIASGVALTRIAAVSSTMTIDTVAQVDEMQRRWGLATAEKAVLANIRTVFDNRDFAIKSAGIELQQPILRDEIALGTASISLVIADEDAKVNLNSLYHTSDQRVVAKELERSMPLGAQRIIALNPAVETMEAIRKKSAKQSLNVDDDGEDDDIEPPRAFGSWGEVFAMRELAGSDDRLAELTRQITLWGNGRCNIARALDETVVSACRPIVQDGLARRIVERYREHPEPGIKLIIDKEVINPRDRLSLYQVIGESSNCFSLWMQCRSKLRTTQQLAVIEPDSEGLLRTIRFAF